MDQKAMMRRVIELSQRGMRGGFGGPYGTVIVKDGEIVGEGHNEVLATNDTTAHAEVLAIRRAGAKLGTFDLSGCEMYVNGTPCCMCMGSILWAHISKVYYALSPEASTFFISSASKTVRAPRVWRMASCVCSSVGSEMEAIAAA